MLTKVLLNETHQLSINLSTLSTSTPPRNIHGDLSVSRRRGTCDRGIWTAPQVTHRRSNAAREKIIKDGRHVGLDFYDLLIEVL